MSDTARPASMWTYGDSLPALPPSRPMGELVTPLVEVAPGVSLKHEQVLPTGSFKARGSAVMVGLAQSLGVEAMVLDSSGNAGLAAAAYAQAASIPLEVFLPATTDPSKVAAIAAHGAAVRLVSGDRQAAAEAARPRVDASGAWYASHVYQPAFHHGVKTLAFELIDSNGEIPATVVVPAGNGTLVIGLWLGFRGAAACRSSRVGPADRRGAGRPVCAAGGCCPERRVSGDWHFHRTAASTRPGEGSYRRQSWDGADRVRGGDRVRGRRSVATRGRCQRHGGGGLGGLAPCARGDAVVGGPLCGGPDREVIRPLLGTALPP